VGPKSEKVARRLDDDELNKRTRTKAPVHVAYHESLFREASTGDFPELEAPELLKSIQAMIVRLDGQERSFITPIKALLASIEAFQTTAEQVLANPDDVDTEEPINCRKARASPQASKWDDAMEDELASLEENETRTLVPRPPPRRVLGGKWVYRLKRGSGGEIQRYKARWVARGFEQRFGIDFNETFAAVVKPMAYKSPLRHGRTNGLGN